MAFESLTRTAGGGRTATRTAEGVGSSVPSSLELFEDTGGRRGRTAGREATWPYAACLRSSFLKEESIVVH